MAFIANGVNVSGAKYFYVGKSDWLRWLALVAERFIKQKRNLVLLTKSTSATTNGKNLASAKLSIR